MNHISAITAGRFRSPWLVFVLNVLLATAGAGAAAVLVLEHGFHEPIVSPVLLHGAAVAIVAVFVADRFMRLMLARRRREYFRDNWIDFSLIFLAASAAAISSQVHGKVLSAGALYVIITQVYMLVSLVLRAVNVNLRMAGSGIHPGWLLIGSFAFLILAGSGLLMLPVSVAPDAPRLYYPDALFTATSATCVTGLITRDTAVHWSVTGQAIILVLIQLGGLGIMLFGTTLAVLVGKAISVRGSDAIGHMVGSGRAGDLGRIVKFVLLVVLALEAAGACLLYPMFADTPAPGGGTVSTAQAVWLSVFHSISSFCNAGFSLFSENMMAGVREGWRTPLREHWQVMGVMAPLIVLGGLGFPVLDDCARYARGLLSRVRRRRSDSAARKSQRPRLSLHSKIVLSTTGALLLFGAAGLLLIEPRPVAPERTIGRHEIVGGDSTWVGDWQGLSGGRRIRAAVFHSVSARTAGFNTIDMSELSDAGKLWMCGLMTIGGSPASTAGGMKTVTFALLVLSAWCVLRRREELEVYERSVSSQLLRRAVTIAVLYMALLVAITLLLGVTMRGQPFIDVFFEASSACGTVGLSTGLTRKLTELAKFVVIAGMFAGRLGPLTLMLALTSRMRHVKYSYPTETVVIG